MYSNNSSGLLEDKDDIFSKHDEPETIVLLCFYIPVFVIALLGNALVLSVVIVNKRMRSATNYFLVNLAVADELVTLICIPMTVASKVYTVWMYGSFMCRLTDYMQGISICASVLTIVLLSVDRYLTIRHPLRSRRYCTIEHARRAIVIVWIVSAIVMIPLILVKKLDVFYLAEDDYLAFCREEWPSLAILRAYDIFLFCVIYAIPGTVIIALYVRIGSSLWSPGRDLCRQNSRLSNGNNLLLSRRRVAKMMVAISFLFAACWLPYYILMIHSVFWEETKWTDNLFSYALLLGHSNSAQNPLLYCCMHKGFKAAVKKLVFCCKKEIETVPSGPKQPQKRERYTNNDPVSSNNNDARELLEPLHTPPIDGTTMHSLRATRSDIATRHEEQNLVVFYRSMYMMIYMPILGK